MSDFLIQKVLAKLGVLCLEYHSDGYFSCLGEPPSWAVELYPCIRNRFPRILPIDISSFLDNFMVDALEFWQEDSAQVFRSGYWTETTSGFLTDGNATSNSEVNVEALVLTVDQTPLLLLEVSEVKFDQTFKWLQLARRERLDSLEERKANASQMTSLSLFDPLTGLPNEQAFSIQLARWIEQLRQGELSQFLFIKLNIDRFRHINFTLGRSRADQCLVQLARRVRRYLWVQDVFARLGADEFVILVRVPSGLSEEAWIERLMLELRSPYQLDSEQLQTTVSLGVLRVEDPNTDLERCLADVSIALNQAKEFGRGQFCWFNAQWRDRSVAKLRQEQQLLSEIKSQELRLLWQPIYSKQTGQITGIKPSLDSLVLGQNDAELQQLVTEVGLTNQLAIYRVESCLTLLSQVAPEEPLVFLLTVPLQSFSDLRFLQGLKKLLQSLRTVDQVVLQLTGLNQTDLMNGAVGTLKDALARLATAKSAALHVGMMLDATDPMLLKTELMSVIGSFVIALERSSIKVSSKGKIEYPKLQKNKKQDYLIIAEAVNDKAAYEKAIASKFIDLYYGNHISEPLPTSALLQLLKTKQS